MRACDTQPAGRTQLLVVVLGIASAVAACRNNQASPAATSGTTMPISTLGAARSADVAGLFDTTGGGRLPSPA
jgi:hypothetical protein